MDVNINSVIFEGEDFPVDESLLVNLKDEHELTRDMLKSGHYRDGLDISMFLREDLSINLDKLAVATQLATRMLEASTPDQDATLRVINLDGYYEKRGILDNEAQMREEKTFLMHFISGEAMEVSENDTLEISLVNK